MRETEKEAEEKRQRWYSYAAYTVAALSFFVAFYIARASIYGLASNSLASSLVWFVIDISVAAVFCAAGLLLDVHARLNTVDDLKGALALLEARIGAEVLQVGQWDLKTVQTLLESTIAGDEVRRWITFLPPSHVARPVFICRDVTRRSVDQVLPQIAGVERTQSEPERLLGKPSGQRAARRQGVTILTFIRPSAETNTSSCTPA